MKIVLKSIRIEVRNWTVTEDILKYSTEDYSFCLYDLDSQV